MIRMYYFQVDRHRVRVSRIVVEFIKMERKVGETWQSQTPKYPAECQGPVTESVILRRLFLARSSLCTKMRKLGNQCIAQSQYPLEDCHPRPSLFRLYGHAHMCSPRNPSCASFASRAHQGQRTMSPIQSPVGLLRGSFWPAVMRSMLSGRKCCTYLFLIKLTHVDRLAHFLAHYVIQSMCYTLLYANFTASSRLPNVSPSSFYRLIQVWLVAVESYSSTLTNIG